MPERIVKFMVVALITFLGFCITSCGKHEMRQAIQSQDVQAVQRLLQKGVDINATDEHGDTPLMLGVLFSHMDSLIRAHNPTMVKFLLEQGADINAKANGCTPLITAAFFGDLETVKLLLDHGADLNILDDHGITAVQSAADGGHPQAVKLLLSKGGKITLAAAGCIGDPAEVQRLIQEGADVNANGFLDSKPLMAAIRGGNLDIIKMLLEKGADVHIRSLTGETALMMAVSAKDQPDVVKLLLEKGADVNACTEAGETPLMLAVDANDQPETIKLLLDKGADVNARTRAGRTAFKIASERLRLDTLKLLKAYGAKE
jgi:ankyrin repeat protein